MTLSTLPNFSVISVVLVVSFPFYEEYYSLISVRLREEYWSLGPYIVLTFSSRYFLRYIFVIIRFSLVYEMTVDLFVLYDGSRI